MNLYICTGLIGSGKSTWSRKMVQAGKAVCVSRDDMRMMLGAGEYIYDKETLEPFVRDLSVMAVSMLVKIKSVIVDETNLTKAHRSKFINIAEQYNATPIIVLFTENENNLVNRMKNPRGKSRDRWSEVLEGMREIFEEPTVDECGIICVDNPFRIN